MICRDELSLELGLIIPNTTYNTCVTSFMNAPLQTNAFSLNYVLVISLWHSLDVIELNEFLWFQIGTF